MAAGGDSIEVTAMYGNAYNFAEVERCYTSAGTTTVEQFLYEYDDSLGSDFLSQVTLRRKVGAGSWTNVSRAVYAYYEKTPGALAELRAPIFEDKVVDFILERAKPVEKKVSKEELFEKPEEAAA